MRQNRSRPSHSEGGLAQRTIHSLPQVEGLLTKAEASYLMAEAGRTAQVGGRALAGHLAVIVCMAWL